MWMTTVTAALQFSIFLPDAASQLTTSPAGDVCVGQQIMYFCRRSAFLTWVVNRPSGTEYLKSGTFSTSSSLPPLHTEMDIGTDTRFRFTFTFANSSNIHSELHVTAERELNGYQVVCEGSPGRTPPRIIRVSSTAPPAAPSAIMKNVVEGQFTADTASVNLTWSASSEADNYTVVVTPTPPEISTTRVVTNLQLSVGYNVEYSINITAHNCAGSNSTIFPLRIGGCGLLHPFPNGMIRDLISRAVGATLVFQCNSGYLPHAEVTSTCLKNSSWVPVPKCTVIDCGPPNVASGLTIEYFNGTELDAFVTFHCEQSNFSGMAVCTNSGEWIPNPASLECVDVTQCGPPTAPVNGHINANYSSTVDGSQITFNCGGDSPVMNSTCRNGRWIPDPSALDCGQPGGDRDSNIGLYTGLFSSILLVVMFITIAIIVIIAIKKKQGLRSKPFSFELDSCQDSDQGYSEYAQTQHPGPRIVDQGNEDYSELRHSTQSKNPKTQLIAGHHDTLVYADIGSSSIKCSAHCPAASNFQGDRVMYSTINLALQQPTKRLTNNKTGPCPADKSLDLDSLLIQLKPQVTDKWEQFAKAVGLSNIIKELSQYSPDECIVEVFDQWLKSHPTKPTWSNVADVLNDIGLHQLADDILKVYETGKLPIIVDMDTVPENLTSDNGTPPPIPHKLQDSGWDCKAESVQQGQRSVAVPPRPPKPPVRPPKPVF